MAFIKKENKPSVIMFKGRVTIPNIGFTIKTKKESAAAPIMYVLIPPEIVKPIIICDVKKSATA